jgi:hypothetical protein
MAMAADHPLQFEAMHRANRFNLNTKPAATASLVARACIIVFSTKTTTTIKG